MRGCVSSTFNSKWKHYICICLKNDDINGQLALYVSISNLALKLTLIAKYVHPNGCELYWYVAQIQAPKQWGVKGTCQFTNAARSDEYIHQRIRIASVKMNHLTSALKIFIWILWERIASLLKCQTWAGVLYVKHVCMCQCVLISTGLCIWHPDIK